MSTTISLDIATVELIAEAAARAAVERVSDKLSDSMQRGFERLEGAMAEKISNEFKLHFGNMNPTDHVVQHSRLQKMLDFGDEARKTMWKAIITKATEYLLVAVIVGAALLYSLKH